MNSKQLRNSILSLAIRGRLVSQDSNDEPAIELLKRINPKATPITEKLPFDLPDSWCWTTLGEISNYGCCESTDVNSINPTDWVLELEDIEKGSARVLKAIPKSERKIKGVRHKFHKGQILYSKLRTYLNKVLLVQSDGFCTTEIIPIEIEEKISPQYILYVLKSNYFINYTLSCVYGMKMPRLSTRDARRGFIPLPPLAEQERIVKEVERWFANIEQLERSREALGKAARQTKRHILSLAISGRLVPQDPNDEPASELLNRINPKFTPQPTDSPLPQGWTACTLEDIVEIKDNLRQPINSAERNKRIAGKKDSELFPYYGATGQVGYIDKYLMDGKYLLLGEDGAPFLDKMATKAYIVEGKCWVNNHAHVLLPNCNTDYMCIFLNQFSYYNYVTGSTRLKLTQASMKKMPVLVPPLAEQERIVQKVEELFAVLDALQ